MADPTTTKKGLTREQVYVAMSGVGLIELGYACVGEQYNEQGDLIYVFKSPEYQTIELRVLMD